MISAIGSSWIAAVFLLPDSPLIMEFFVEQLSSNVSSQKDYKMLLFIWEQKPFYGLAKWIHLVFFITFKGCQHFHFPPLNVTWHLGGREEGGKAVKVRVGHFWTKANWCIFINFFFHVWNSVPLDHIFQCVNFVIDRNRLTIDKSVIMNKNRY